MERMLPILIALTIVAALPVASAGGVRVYDCTTYGPGMQCLDHRDIVDLDSDLIPFDVEVCGEIFYPSASC